MIRAESIIVVCLCVDEETVHACSVMSDSFATPGLCPAGLLCPWNSPGKNTGLGCHFLLQEIFPTQGSNLSLLHWQADSLPLEPSAKPREMNSA